MSWRILIGMAAVCLWVGVGCTTETPDAARTSGGSSLRAAPEATSLLGEPLYALPQDSATTARQEAQLAEAQAAFDQAPDAVDSYVWLGRRTAYLGHYREAISIFSEGLGKHPESAELLRHRGHRYLSVREFDRAISDLSKAAQITMGQPDIVEPDGQPNAAGIPTSTLQTNIWYHLALAHYFEGGFEQAATAMQACLELAANNDMRVAAADWLYMALRRSGSDREAAQVISFVTPDLELLENHSYHKRIMMYRGLLSPEELLGTGQTLDVATQGYGVANFYLVEGDSARALTTLRSVLETGYWPAFGYIAAEADLARLSEQDG